MPRKSSFIRLLIPNFIFFLQNNKLNALSNLDILFPGSHSDPDAGRPEVTEHCAGGQVSGPLCSVLIQLPECLLLPAVARLGLRCGLSEAITDRPDQDQAKTQTPSAQTEIKIHLCPVRREGGIRKSFDIKKSFKEIVYRRFFNVAHKCLCSGW